MPFQIDGKDDRSKEEMKLFHQMAATYKRRAASSSQHGYHAFANAWNIEAGRRRTAYISGDENMIVIHSKSVKMLQDCYDKVTERLEIARQANDVGERRGHALRLIQRDVRRSAETPIVDDARPEVFPTLGDSSDITKGNPFVAPPNVTVANISGRVNHSAPYNIPVSTKKRKKSAAEPLPE